ncbi:hypothetical protein [Erwinia billingiae]|uniref:hypothetical protein n=1 Tax=Erwinia billingiae TaxID=182337 RepID=UPI00320B1C60
MKIKWLKLDSQMVAVDTPTGEIVNDQLTTLPADYDVSSCVNEVLDDLFGGSLITTSLINSPSKRGPKPKKVANPYASFFSDVQYSETQEKATWVIRWMI